MKTIQTTTHLLLVDETAEINNNNWFINLANNTINQATNWIYVSTCRKIIAASPKLGDLPEFETLPPNMPIKESINPIQELINELKDTLSKCLPEFKTGIQHSILRASAYLENQQAKSETRFSWNQVLHYIGKGFRLGKQVERQPDYYSLCDPLADLASEILQSLTKPKEYEFVVETICAYGDDCPSKGAYDKQHLCNVQPKIINKDGKTFIQGVWKEV